MDSIEEKRVYGDRSGAVEAYVASSIGVVRVRVAGDTVGEFALCERCDARDIAAADEAVAVATDEDVLVRSPENDEAATDAADTSFVETGFGPAVAVGVDGDALIAADSDGRVARSESANGDWVDLESDAIDAVRAIDGDLVGTDAGVYRVHDGGFDHAGLTAVSDVSAAGVPLAATDEGLYKLGNGWMEILDGAFRTVAADPRSEPGQLARAHASTDETIFALDDGEWRERGIATGPVVGIGYGDAVYAVTEHGTFCAAEEGEEWRTRALGIDGVTGLAVVSAHATQN
ncbi:hypothetical protein ACLI4Z_00070 [Natrialbaceae archaeon A-arb3/5]